MAVLSGNNGAGKSSVIDGIRFALFGFARGSSLDSVITHGEQNCSVEFIFALGEETYRVLRKRSSKGSGSTMLSFSISAPHPEALVEELEPGFDWQGLDGKSVAETQKRIEGVLKMTDRLFTATACANQGNAAAFSAAKPAERKSILGEILDLEDWERFAEAGRGEVRAQLIDNGSSADLINLLNQQVATLDPLNEELAFFQQDISNYETLAAEKQAAKDAGLQQKESLIAEQAAAEERTRQYAEKQKAVAELRIQIEASDKRIASLRATADALPGLRHKQEHLEAARVEEQELEAKRQQYQALVDELKALEYQSNTLRQEWATKRTALINAQRFDQQQRSKAIELLELEITSKNNQWVSGVEKLEQQIALLEKQANPLGEVPCASVPNLAEMCPLIKGAREAKQQLPTIQAESQALQAHDPALDMKPEIEQLESEDAALRESEAAALAALPEECPEAAAIVQEISSLKKQQAEVSYDAARHQAVKLELRNVQDLQEQVSKAEAAAAQLAEASANRRDVAQRLEAAVEALNAAKPEEAKDFTRLLTAITTQLEQIGVEIQVLADKVKAAHQSEARLEQSIEQAKAAEEKAEVVRLDLAAGEKRLVVLKALAEGYSKKGAPALLIELAIPDLEAEANEVLALLSDGQMGLNLISQRETQNGKGLSETLDILVSQGARQQAYEDYSGGERMRVDLALRIGLSKLLTRRAGARCEILICDEVCAPLDLAGQDLFIECLQRLSDQFASILCISHIERLKDAFPTSIEITKDINGSRLEVITR